MDPEAALEEIREIVSEETFTELPEQIHNRSIKTKDQMFKLLKSGLLGNHLRVWDSAEELQTAIEAGFDGLIGVRCVGLPEFPFFPKRTHAQALEIVEAIRSQYNCEVKLCESSPDEHIILQGEFAELNKGPVLEWSTVKTHMRDALARERHCLFGPGARLVLKRVFTDASYQDFLSLGELFPEAVIEFTAYDILVGNLPGRNVICWECRNY